MDIINSLVTQFINNDTPRENRKGEGDVSSQLCVCWEINSKPLSLTASDWKTKIKSLSKTNTNIYFIFTFIYPTHIPFFVFNQIKQTQSGFLVFVNSSVTWQNTHTLDHGHQYQSSNFPYLWNNYIYCT